MSGRVCCYMNMRGFKNESFNTVQDLGTAEATLACTKSSTLLCRFVYISLNFVQPFKTCETGVYKSCSALNMSGDSRCVADFHILATVTGPARRTV